MCTVRHQLCLSFRPMPKLDMHTFYLELQMAEEGIDKVQLSMNALWEEG